MPKILKVKAEYMDRLGERGYQEKDDQKKRSEILGEFAKEIGRARLEEICEAVKYIGQTGYAVCTDLEDNLIVAPVEINKIEISDNNIWIKGTGSCEFYTLAVIGYLIFFGENAKQLAESKYNELTAQGEL